MWALLQLRNFAVAEWYCEGRDHTDTKAPGCVLTLHLWTLKFEFHMISIHHKIFLRIFHDFKNKNNSCPVGLL